MIGATWELPNADALARKLFLFHRADGFRLSRIAQHLSQLDAGRFEIAHERRLFHERVRNHRCGDFASADVPRKVLAD